MLCEFYDEMAPTRSCQIVTVSLRWEHGPLMHWIELCLFFSRLHRLICVYLSRDFTHGYTQHQLRHLAISPSIILIAGDLDHVFCFMLQIFVHNSWWREDSVWFRYCLGSPWIFCILDILYLSLSHLSLGYFVCQRFAVWVLLPIFVLWSLGLMPDHRCNNCNWN
jgi:hypothetical protein